MNHIPPTGRSWHNESSGTFPDEKGQSCECQSLLKNIQSGDSVVTQSLQTKSITVVDAGVSQIKEISTLGEYIAERCHSLRNQVSVVRPKAPVSLPPESFLDAAEQRLLSMEELDCMQQHINLQTEIDINGVSCELETLPDDTPLFYQFYCQDQYSRIDDESIRIFKNNCTIEKGRPAIILINSSLMNDTVQSQIDQLKQAMKNVHVVDTSELLNKYRVAGMVITQHQHKNGKIFLRINASNCTLKNKSFTDGRERDYPQFHDILDILQFMAMYHCDKVYELARIEARSRGCIKIDWDMELIAPIGSLKCPKGFSTFVIDKLHAADSGDNELTHSLQVENSLMAVTRPQHHLIAEAVCPSYRVFSNFTGAVSKGFNKQLHAPSYEVKKVSIVGHEIDSVKMLCTFANRDQIARAINPEKRLSIRFNKETSWKQKIAFPLCSIKADQSRVRGISSWQEKPL